jgi:hypothetical protein
MRSSGPTAHPGSGQTRLFFLPSFNEIWIPVPNIRRDSVCRSSFASDFDPFDETSFILSRQNSDAFFDLSASPLPLITLTCYESDECGDDCDDCDDKVTIL